MTNYANSATYNTYLRHQNVELRELLQNSTSGHAAQLRADRDYSGSFDMDDDIYANERYFIEREVA